MQISGGIAFVSGLSLALGLGCGQSHGSERRATDGGSLNAAGSFGSSAGANPAATGGSSPSEVGGAGQGSSAGGAGQGSFGGGDADAGATGNTEPSDVQTLLDTYRTFSPQTSEPINVSGYIFGLCRLPTLRESEFQASIHGDGRYLQDWANPLAAQGIATHGTPTFPVGAVIVKEKYAGPHVAQADLVALALMIKRGSGFDPAHGDWDYAYYEPALGVVQSTEQTTYCASCHAAAATTDFVFVDGLKPE